MTAKYVNSLVELITSNIDLISTSESYPGARPPPGLVEGVNTADMITRHFKNTLIHIRGRKESAGDAGETGADWDQIDIVGALLKMGLSR